MITYPRVTKLIIMENPSYVDQNKEAYELKTCACAELVSIKGKVK